MAYQPTTWKNNETKLNADNMNNLERGITGLFQEDSYIASNGKENKMYIMNRNGFVLLVMGYTGATIKYLHS